MSQVTSSFESRWDEEMQWIAFPVVLGKIKCIRSNNLSLYKSIHVI